MGQDAPCPSMDLNWDLCNTSFAILLNYIWEFVKCVRIG